MSTQVRFRRGSTADHAAFTGASGELTVNTDTGRIHIHDGVTVGGKPSALFADLISGFVRIDIAQGLTTAAQIQARANIGVVANTGLRNRHVNPALQIIQNRALAATVVLSADGYACDGVGVLVSGGGAFTGSVVAKVTPGGSPTRARLVVSTADAAISAADRYAWSLPIEGIDISDLAFGSAGARPFTYRYGVNQPAGSYSLSFQNAAGSRSYVVPYTITAGQAGTDVILSGVVTGDTAGTWISDASGNGICVRNCIAAGATYQTSTVNAWQTGNFLTTVAQSNGMATVSTVYEMADLGLYVGSELPAFEVPRWEDDLRRCQRYWESSYPYGVPPGSASQLGAWGWINTGDLTLSLIGAGGAFSARKRTAPQIAIWNPVTGAANGARVNGGDLGVGLTGSTASALSQVYLPTAQPSGSWVACAWVADARLTL